MTGAIALGVLAALLYGATDFCARFAGRAAGTLRTICYSHGLSAVATSIPVWFTGIPAAAPRVWLLLLLSSMIGLVATVSLYRALAAGALAVVSPIAATYGGIAAMLSALAGARFSVLAAAGLILACIGGICTARAAGPARPFAGGRDAILAALCYGVSLWMQGDEVIPSLGCWVPVASYYILGTAVALGYAALRRRSLALPTDRGLGMIVITAALACGGTVALAAGQATGAVAIATVLSALATAVTVILARLFLKEPMTPTAWIGLALVICGVSMLRAS